MPGVDIHKDDNVRVMAGKDRGYTGRVIRVIPSERLPVARACFLARAAPSTSTRPSEGITRITRPV